MSPGNTECFHGAPRQVRDIIASLEPKYGAQASELLQAIADYISFDCRPGDPGGSTGDRVVQQLTTEEDNPNFEENHKRKGSTDLRKLRVPTNATQPQHKCSITICSHIDEARYEHKAFQICLLQGIPLLPAEVDHSKNSKRNKDLKDMQDLVTRYVDGEDERGCCFGNLAWGNGSTQGIVSRVNGKDVTLVCGVGLDRVTKMLGEEIEAQEGMYDVKKSNIFFSPHRFGRDEATRRCLVAFDRTVARVARKVEAESPDVLPPTTPFRILED